MWIAARGLMPFAALLASTTPEAEPEPDPRADVLAITKHIEAGKDVTARVAAFKKTHEDLAEAMRAFRPRAQGGVGYGEAGPEDGIARELSDLAREALPPARLKREKADLLKMAHATIAVARISHEYKPGRFARAPRAAVWIGHAEDVEKASKGLIEAVKNGDAKALKLAATSINKACAGCHADYRDERP